MAEKTTNYGLTKPLESEYYDIDVFNDNADIVDNALKEIQDNAGGDYLPLSGGNVQGDINILDSNSEVVLSLDNSGNVTGDGGNSVLSKFNTITADYGNFNTVTLGTDPSTDMQAATKRYVDKAVSDIDVDSAIDGTSTNPVQNKVISEALSTQSPFYADIVIASSDTPENLQVNADYVINTSNTANTTINEAITNLSDTGGKIVLLSGTYNCNSYINLQYCDNITLQGCGTSTVINSSNSLGVFAVSMYNTNINTICDMYINYTGSGVPIYLTGAESSNGTIKFINNYIKTANDTGLLHSYNTPDTYYNVVFANNTITGTTTYYDSGGSMPSNYNNILVGNIFDDGFTASANGTLKAAANIGLDE